MITPRMLKIFELRQKYSSFFNDPFVWDDKANGLKLSSKWRYSCWLICFFCQCIYVCGLSARLLMRIWEEDVVLRDMTADAGFLTVLLIAVPPMALFPGQRDTNISFFNSMVKLDRKLQESTLLKKRLSKFSNLKLVTLVVEILMFSTAVVTTLAPFLFGISVFDRSEPFHRFLKHFLGWQPRLNIKTIFVSLIAAYSGVIAANTIHFFSNAAFMYVLCAIVWLKCLTVEDVDEQPILDLKSSKSKSQRKGATNNDAGNKINTLEASTTTGKDIQVIKIACTSTINMEEFALKVYRALQVLNQGVNLIFGHFFMSVHFGSCMGTGTLCCFIAFRWYHKVDFTIIIMSILGAVLTTGGIMIEMKICNAILTTSGDFIAEIKKRSKRKSYSHKVAKSCWPIELATGKPFFRSDNGVFVTYFQKLMDFVATLLLSNTNTN